MVAHMLFKIAILAIVISSATSAAIDNGDFDIDVSKTVENVQSILEAHPELPRLSDDDILTLLQNITAEDKRKIGVPKTNVSEEKIMVVLPFKPTDSDIEDMTDLFTKRPITKYVSSHSYNDVETTTEVVTITTTTKEPEKITKKPSKKATAQKHTESESQSKQKVVEPFKEFPSNDQLSVESLEVPYSEVSAYENFKPLPMVYQQEAIDVPIDVQNLLKMYNLLENSQKLETIPENEASTEIPVSFEFDNNPKFEQVDANMFPPEMASVLSDLGLTKTNPSNAYLPINDETNNSNGSQHQLASGVDPLSLEDIASVDDSLSNDIKKRQQSDNSTKTETSTETVSTTTESLKEVSTTSEGPSIEDLENSFGGSKADDDPSEAELPPPRRNGFYYMVDWNSFLEVGDGDTKVNIRFNPKLGDPQRFIPVSIP